MSEALDELDGPAEPATDTSHARLRALVEEHFDVVWRLLRRLGMSRVDADDSAQQVFMIATQKLDKIASGSERSFLYGTALRVAANARRAAQRNREVPEQPTVDLAAAERTNPEQGADLARAWDFLDSLLDRLPDELRRVLVLADIEQVEVSEIAALEGIPAGTAASRLRRARSAFRDELRRMEHKNPFKEGS